MKPFAVRFRDDQWARPKLSRLRFATAAEARDYARDLSSVGALNVAVVELDGRRIVSSRSVCGPAKPPQEVA